MSEAPASAVARPARRSYSVVDQNDDDEDDESKRRSETGCYTALLVFGILFAVAGVVVMVLLLTASDLTMPERDKTSPPVSSSAECAVDADCDSCCDLLRGDRAAMPVASLNPCLLPPNGSSSYVCVEQCCVPPAPRHAPDGTPCDDGRWCSMQDRCYAGQCVGVERECRDSDFCTLEECSETLRMCVSGDVRDDPDCEHDCEVDEDCRTEYYCLPSKRCGKFPDVNGTMLLTEYNLEHCGDLPGDAYRMVQHYTVFERTYERHGDLRVRHARDILLPGADGYDRHQLEYSPLVGGVPLVDVLSVSDTKLVSYGGESYAQTSVTVRTACQEIFPDDPDVCLSMWANRQYDFEVAFRDCAASQTSPLSVDDASCLTGDIRRAYTMALSVVYCPTGKTAHTQELTWLVVASPLSPTRPQTEFGRRETVRVVWESESGVYLDPFLTDVAVCAVDTSHRLAPCALNEYTSEECPFRGCNGWPAHDSPLKHRKVYMQDSMRTAEASFDDVHFCRKSDLYQEGGCAAGVCAWSLEPGRSSFGGADGFQFTLNENEGETIVVDVSARHALCDLSHADKQTEGGKRRKIGVARVQSP